MRYTYDLNSPSITGLRPRTIAVLTKAEWKNIEGKINEPRSQKEKAEAARDKENKKLERSREMTQHWKNTVTKIQENREKQRIETIQKMEERKVQEYEEIMKEREKQRQETMERAREIVYERKESCQRVLSGLTLSVVLEERRRQIDLHKKLKQEMKQRAAVFAEKIRKDALEYEEELKQAKLLDVQKKEQYLEVVRQQLEENKLLYDAAEKEKEWEREDMIHLQKELEEDEKKKINDKTEKMIKFKKEQAEQLEYIREQKEKREQEEREQAEINAIYQDVAEKLNQRRKDEEDKIKKEIVERRIMLQKKVKRESIDYAKEEESRLKAVDEQEDKYRKDQEAKKEKKENLKRELLNSEKEVAVENANRRNRENAKKRWEYLERLAKAEADAKMNKETGKCGLKEKEEYRKILIEQWKEKDDNDLKEKVDDVKYFNEERQHEYEALVKYCNKIQNYVQEKELPMYPITMAIDGAIKSLGMRETNNRVPFLQSKVPISSVAVYES